VLATVALAPSTAQGASFFQKKTDKTSVEVHLDSGRIIYLHLDAPVHCTDGGFVEEIADTRTPIRVRRTGAFAFVDQFRNGSEYGKAVVKGVIRHGRLDGEYRFVHVLGGDACWSGEQIEGSAESPEGSAVPLSVSRHKGLRFYKDSGRVGRSASTYFPNSFSPAVYMWIGGGKVYGLTAILPETCVTHQSGYPPSTNHFDLVLARTHPVRVNARTHEIHVREVDRTGTGRNDREIWNLSADVSRDAVAGDLSHTYDYRYVGGDTLHCQTGGKSGPVVEFDARHR